MHDHRGPAKPTTELLARCHARWYGLALVILVLAAYSSVFSAGFIWDDDAYVLDNIHLQSLEGLFHIWFEPGSTPQYYPLVFTTFWLENHLWGANPFGYHLVNILFHAGNAVLLWTCLRRISVPGAFLAACFFAIHPVQVESVAWVTELKNVQSTFFYLLAFLAYWQGFGENNVTLPRRSRVGWWITALLCFSFALFSKTVSGSLPAAILLVSWWRDGRLPLMHALRLIPFFLLAWLLGKQTAKLEVTHVLAQGPEWDFSFLDRLLIAGRAACFYAGKMLWPHPLIFNYPRWDIDPKVWWQYLFPLGIVCLLLIFWRFRARWGRGPLAAVLFFLGSLFPALGFFNVYPMRFSFVADHFQYLASIGVCVLLGAGIYSFLQRPVPHTGRLLLVSVFPLLLTMLTWRQGRIYRDNLTLFTDTIAKNPASWFSYSNRATLQANDGNDDLALADIEKSLGIKPDEADALHLRGMINLKRKNVRRAFVDFDRSIELRPWRTDYIKNRCMAYRHAGLRDKALADADRVVKLQPADPANYLLRASIYVMGEAYGAALADLDKAIALDPQESDAWANRGLVYFRQNHNEKAIADFSRAIALRPDSAGAYYNRGLAYAALGNSINATGDLNQAKRLGYAITDREMGTILSQAKNATMMVQKGLSDAGK